MDRRIKLPGHIGTGIMMSPPSVICKTLSKFPASTGHRKPYSRTDWDYFKIEDQIGEINHLSDSRIQNLLILIYGKDIKEYVYRDYLADNIQGSKAEVIIRSGIVDILTPDTVIEVKKANNWKHAMGQTLSYSAELHKKPCVALIGKLSPICKQILYYYGVDNIELYGI